MSYLAPPIELSDEDRGVLLGWTRSGTVEHRMAFRARIILAAADGKVGRDIARELGTREATVSKWRRRFQDRGLAGMSDSPRPGKPSRYTDETTRAILACLDAEPPTGHAVWTGPLIARKLSIGVDHVWKVLRERRISLTRRHSWCQSTDPDFATKAADIVGLYLEPPRNALVLCVDEKPAIQALERNQGWIRMPDGKAITGYNHEYRRNGTTTLFAALDAATGLVTAGHFKRRKRRQFLAFMNQIVAAHPDREIHVILDNLNTHKPKTDRWLPRHPNVHFHYTPTHASWLDQIEIWFSILWKGALRGGSFKSIRDLRGAIDRFIEAYNQDAHPFQWKATRIRQRPLEKRYSNLDK